MATVLMVLMAACGADAEGAPELSFGAARAAEPVGGASQVVVDVTNDGPGADRLVAASSPSAVAVEIHRTSIVDGRASMEQLDDLELGDGETVRFRPGGLHLMLVAPDESVVLGGTFPVTLNFEHSGEHELLVEVVDQLDLAESTFDTPAAG